ncbi:hypothetical protein D3C72_1242560 [compost metagenome]
MRFLVRNRRQQAPVDRLGVFLEQRLEFRQHTVDRAQEAAGIDIIEIAAVTEILLLKPREGAVFIHRIEEIKDRGGEGLIFVERAKPGDGLFVGHVQRHGQLRMYTLEQTDRHGIGDGVRQLFIFYLFQ